MNFFVNLRRLDGEKYMSEMLGWLLSEFPRFRSHFLQSLYNLHLDGRVSVRTQVRYALPDCDIIPDIVLVSRCTTVFLEVKAGAPLSEYPSPEGEGENPVNQIARYEEYAPYARGELRVCLLSGEPMDLRGPFHLFQPSRDHRRWKDVYRATSKFLGEVPDGSSEYYLLSRFLGFLKERGMAPFDGFDLSHVAALALVPDTENLCHNLGLDILERVQIDGFKGDHQDAYNRCGALFRWSKDPSIKVFAGLWLSSAQYYEFKFPQTIGPQVTVFFEISPRRSYRDWRNRICDSPAFARAKTTFQADEERGWQLLLTHRPLADFVGSPDQRESLLSYFEGNVQELREAGLFHLLDSLP